MALEMMASARRFTFGNSLQYILNDASFYIYQGIPPVNANAYDAVARAGDLLATFGVADLVISDNNDGLITTTLSNSPTATATGTATWFAAYKAGVGNQDAVMTGTVGITGSGADFELLDTALVSGTQVDFASFEFQMS